MKESPLKEDFNPSSVGLLNGNLYGLPFSTKDAQAVVIPVPWDVTVSYREGAHSGPQKMLDASVQMDLFDEDFVDCWKLGLAMEPISKEILRKNKILRPLAIECLDHLANGGAITDKKVAGHYARINKECEVLNAWVQARARAHLDAGKMVCVLGGEHSVSLGLLRELNARHAKEGKKFSILHIDAHADLRDGFEGFTYSHASIMFNARQLSQVEKLSVVSIRDYCQEEADLIAVSKLPVQLKKGLTAEQKKLIARIEKTNPHGGDLHAIDPVRTHGRTSPITAFTDRQMKYAHYRGLVWAEQCKKIVASLGTNVYISFDIDALDPKLCPHTGTPVPGGLEYEQVMFLFKVLAESGRKIIGFDLSEVAPGVIAPGDLDSWDAVVGMRALYRMINYMAQSRGVIS